MADVDGIPCTIRSSRVHGALREVFAAIQRYPSDWRRLRRRVQRVCWLPRKEEGTLGEWLIDPHAAAELVRADDPRTWRLQGYERYIAPGRIGLSREAARLPELRGAGTERLRGPRVGAASGADAQPRAGAAGGSTRGVERRAGDRGGVVRRRLPPPITDVQRVPEAPLDKHDLPPAGSPGTRTAAEAMEEPVPVPDIPEVVYDGGADHVFETGSQAEVADAGYISGDAGTIAFWVKPGWQPNSQDDASFVQLGDNGLEIIKNVNFLRFQYIDGAGQEHGGGADIGEWQAGEWHHVIGTWTGGTLSLYVDGGQVFLNGAPTPPQFRGETKLYVGSAFPDGTPVAPGQVSYLTVLNRNASGDEIRQMFESTGPGR